MHASEASVNEIALVSSLLGLKVETRSGSLAAVLRWVGSRTVIDNWDLSRLHGRSDFKVALVSTTSYGQLSLSSHSTGELRKRVCP